MRAATDPLVYIVDDDPVVVRALSRMLSTRGFRVQSFASAAAFQSRVPYDGPCCLLLDQRLPDITGLELVERLSPRTTALPVVFVTGYGDVNLSVAAMKAGAFDFLMKPVKIARLLEVVQLALDHSRLLLDGEHARRDLASRLARLTTREREVARFVARGMLNKQIAAELGASEKTIKIHRARVLHKLEVGSAAELAQLMQRISEP